LERDELLQLYAAIRRATEALCAPLAVEDYVVQSMPDASPAKWHLGHTSWFFETFVLREAQPDYRPLEPRWATLFNSYYVAAGERHPRPQRGLLSRPTVDEVYAYRRHVDAGMRAFLESAPEAAMRRQALTIEVGLNHEEQHQELLVTDLEHMLLGNPLQPVYRERPPAAPRGAALGAAGWVEHPGGVVEIGHAGPGFAYDNEQPRHRVWLEPFALADRLVTNAEFQSFIEDGGYERPELWLSEGWDTLRAQGWEAPLYWRREAGRWRTGTLAGPMDVDPHEPVCHVSWYEADAYARWAGVRLPREEEWEAVAAAQEVRGHFAESGRLHPAPLREAPAPGTAAQLYGDVWEWTASPYSPYPGYQPFQGALAEYNGKFMINQMVLRGGSCATPARHVRATYRNFFAPPARWQFSGIRLAR
jgi:ergothioneine biosynthesis protein EgtB